MRRLLTMGLALAAVTASQADQLWAVVLRKSVQHQTTSGTGMAMGNVGVESGGMNASQASSVTNSQYQYVSQDGSASISYEMGLGVYWLDDQPPTLYVCRIDAGTANTSASTSGFGGGDATSSGVANASAGDATAQQSSAGGRGYSESHAASKITKVNLRYTNCVWDQYADLGNGHIVWKLRGILGFNTKSASASGSAFVGAYYPTPPWSVTATSISVANLGVSHHVAKIPLNGVPIVDMGSPTRGKGE